MSLVPRIKKEFYTLPYRMRGYSRKTASRWYYRVKRDNRLYRNIYSVDELKKVHKRGYLAKNIDRYDLDGNEKCNLISDLDYLSLRPYNNDFYKWIDDQNTMERRLYGFRDNFYNIHFSIIARGKRMIFDYDHNKEMVNYSAVMRYIRNAGKRLELKPVFWNSKSPRYVLEYKNGKYYVNKKVSSEKEITAIIRKNTAMYVITDKADFSCKHMKDFGRYGYLKVYIANDYEGNDGNRVLFACMNTIDADRDEDGEQFKVNLSDGTFICNNKTIKIPNWNEVLGEIESLSKEITPVNYYTLSIALLEDGWKITNANGVPFLPRINFEGPLNDYLKYKLNIKQDTKVPFKTKYMLLKNSIYAKYVKKFRRPGIRPYMQKLWISAVKEDLKFKGTSLKEKIWAWKRGFLSFRIEQYGLTEENYNNMLSDYDYHWLNRINNPYQCWINDKTTFRYTMEQFKDYVPEYYFAIFKRNKKAVVSKMPDCPLKIKESLDGALKVIRMKGKVVFKPSAGTHGDGFYCIEFSDSKYYVNGEPKLKADVIDILTTQKSFYVLTDYIQMNSKLKEIYPKSVNSIRVMALNPNGNNPKIMQTYIRIGSSKTGYTDNVGYGGICAMIDENGRIYNPEKLVNHKYLPCPKHPDTNTEIEGIIIPNWEKIKKGVVDICKSLPELEYLGFDVAVTEDGFNIMEINIHQDLHKVADHTPEIRDFYKNKIKYKKMLCGIN